MRRIRWVAVACASALTLAACAADPVTDLGGDVAFTPCSETECSGTLPSGAEFEILLPEEWGGSLALFSHGERDIPADELQDNAAAVADGEVPDGGLPDGGATGDAEEVTASPSATVSAAAAEGGPEPAPLWSGEEKNIADAMLQAGYAIAGASPPESGWAVGAQVIAAEELYAYFVDNIASPNRTYAWGDSTGGLASVRLAELHPDWVSGVAAMCAPMAGPRPTFDLSLDVAYAIKRLLMPKIPLVDFPDEQTAQATFDRISVRIDEIVQAGEPADVAALTFIAGIGHLPDRNRTESGDSESSRIKAYAAGVRRQARHSTVERFILEQRVGGNPSGNEGTDYGLRLTPSFVAQINKIAPGKLDGMFQAMAEGDRIVPQPDAEKAAAAQGELVGNLEVPALSLQNAFDPVYIAQSQSWYRVRTEQNGPEPAANFVDLYVIPPVAYNEQSPAPEGAGGCVFTPRTVLGVMILLNDWVRRGQYPGRDTVGEAFAQRQVTITYDPGPWPEMGLSPLAPPIDVPPEIGAS